MIECRGVSFSYDGAAQALDGIDLSIKDGEFFCILGGNGSGKSTFAKHLNALLQPDAGTVRINGMDASDPELVYDIRSTAGMVFQNPDNQLVATVVEEDIAFGPENMGVEPKEIRKRVDEALATVRMSEYATHTPSKLSGGQKQRIAIARAFIKNAPIVILDEATSALDNKSEAIVQQAIDNLMTDRTVFIIAHRLSTVRNADKIVVVNYGELVEMGSHDELMQKEDSVYRSLYRTQLK